MTSLLSAVPLVAMLVMIIATMLRGAAVAKSSGDRPFAFMEARGMQRIGGLAFGLSIVAIGVAALLAAVNSEGVDAPLALTGAVLSSAGTALVVIAQIQMGRAWRVGVRAGDAPLFVHSGLFRRSRNPIFLGMIATGLGVALVAETWWGWTAWLIFVAACIVQVRIEERHLAASFGQEYEAFRRTVPRWLGWR
jgi:protein-S-isoprenylcysteine O-methyltransferase Ste14